MSSPPNRHHDFERIAVGKRHLVELAARDDFAVAFQRDALAGQFQSCDQFAHRQRLRKLPVFPINCQMNHFEAGKAGNDVTSNFIIPSTLNVALDALGVLIEACRVASDTV